MVAIYQYSRDHVNIFATPIPAGSVYVYDWMLGDYRENEVEEVVISAAGFVYKYTDYCNDYVRTSTLRPVHEGFEPTYDENNVIEVPVYCYNQNYSK